MGFDRILHATDHFRCIPVRGAAHGFQEPVVPKFLVLSVFRLVQAVGIDEEGDAADVREDPAPERIARFDAQGDVGFALDEGCLPVGLEDGGRIVAAVAVVHLPGPEVDDPEEHRHEHELLVVRGKGVVQFPGDVRDGGGLLDGHAENGPRHGHQEACRDAFAAHVADVEVQPVTLEGKVIEVAAHLLRRDHLPVQVDAFLRRERPGNQPHLDIPGHLELALDAFPLGRRPLEFVDVRDQGRLHVGERAREGADLVLTGRLRKGGVEVTVGNVPRLDRQVAQRPEGLPDDPEAHEEHQEEAQQAQADDQPPEPLESAENIPLRAHDAHAPAGGFERGVEDVALLSVNLEGPDSLLQAHHGPSQGLQGRFLTGQGRGEDGLVEEFVGVGVHEVGAAPAHEDDVGVRIGLDGGERLRQPFEGNVQGNGADVGTVPGGQGLAVGDEHLGLQVGGVVLLPVAVGLGPAGLPQEFGQLVPAQVPVLVVVVPFLGGRDGIILHAAGIDGVVVLPRVVVGFEGDGTAAQTRGPFDDAAGVVRHPFRRIQVPVHQPFQVVGGQFHVLQDIGQPEDGIVQHLARPLDGLHADVFPGDMGRIAQRAQEDHGGEQDHPDAQPGRQGLAYLVQDASHGRTSSILTGPLVRTPACKSIWLAFSTMSGRIWNDRCPESGSS